MDTKKNIQFFIIYYNILYTDFRLFDLFLNLNLKIIKTF